MIDIYNPENAKTVQQELRQGQGTEFWQILQAATDEIIKDIEEQIDGEKIRALPANEYKVVMEILKGRKKDLLKLKELPGTLIIELENPNQSEPDFRAYDDIRDLKED